LKQVFLGKKTGGNWPLGGLAKILFGFPILDTFESMLAKLKDHVP